MMMLTHSKDIAVSSTATKLKSGRKWKVAQATDQAIEQPNSKKYKPTGIA